MKHGLSLSLSLFRVSCVEHLQYRISALQVLDFPSIESMSGLFADANVAYLRLSDVGEMTLSQVSLERIYTPTSSLHSLMNHLQWLLSALPPSPDTVRSVFMHILEAIVHMHSRDIIHCRLDHSSVHIQSNRPHLIRFEGSLDLSRPDRLSPDTRRYMIALSLCASCLCQHFYISRNMICPLSVSVSPLA